MPGRDDDAPGDPEQLVVAGQRCEHKSECGERQQQSLHLVGHKALHRKRTSIDVGRMSRIGRGKTVNTSGIISARTARAESKGRRVSLNELLREWLDQRAIARDQAQPEPAVEQVVETKRSLVLETEEEFDAEHGQLWVQWTQE